MKKIYKIFILTLFSTLAKDVKAQDLIKEADGLYDLFNYKKAAELYSQAYWKKETLYTAEHLANCYRQMHDYKNAERWYITAMGFPGSKPENVLHYAEALQNNSKYSEAMDQFESYASLNKTVTNYQLSIWISSCDSSMRWMRHPTAIKIKNERDLNGAQSDWGAVRYQNTVVFTSDRTNKDAEKAAAADKPFFRFDGEQLPDKKIYGWTGNDYLRLYQMPLSGPGPLELFKMKAPTDYHVGAAAFSRDGDEMYFTITKIPEKGEGPKRVIKTINLEIYYSKKDPATGQWGKSSPFKYNNVSKYSVGDPFLTADGNTLYFVSDMPGGKGGTDIYYCIKNSQGDWGTPVNLRDLNTIGNERTPFVDVANMYVYFSSDGGVGMGGLDIYRAERKGISFGRIINLAYPINSPQDDFAFNLSEGGSGYFSSNRIGGLGSDDIYSFSDKKFMDLRLEGIAYDRFSRQPLLNSIITLSKVGGTDLKVQTDSSGAYKFALDDQSDYMLIGEKTDYRSDNQAITTKGLASSRILKKNLYLQKIELNKAIRIENIYYDFNRSDIRPDAALELDKLIKILNENPTIWIELGSHTDSRGNDAYNLALSQRRADAAVKYIVEKGGIDQNRITARGYGETRLLNRCANGIKCTSAEHQLNRRTEFTIVKQ